MRTVTSCYVTANAAAERAAYARFLAPTPKASARPRPAPQSAKGHKHLATIPTAGLTAGCLRRTQPGGATDRGGHAGLSADGKRPTTVAWHHDGDAYWISNTLNESIPNQQLVGLAASLIRTR